MTAPAHRPAHRIGLGAFIHGDGLLHRLDARLKLLLVVAAALLVFLAPWSAIPAAVALCAFLSLVSVTGRTSTALRALKPLAVIVLLALAMRSFDPSLLQVPAGGAAADSSRAFVPFVSQLPLSVDGAIEGLSQSLRVIAMALTAALLCATTAPAAMMSGLSWLLRPLALLGVPVDRAAKVGGMALLALPAMWTLVAARFKALDVDEPRRLSERAGAYADALVMSLVDSVTLSRTLCEPAATSDSLDMRTALP